MRLLIVGLTLISLAQHLGAQDCACVALKRDEITRRGYSAEVVVEERKIYRRLRGVVRFPQQDDPVENVFVEVFTSPEKWLSSSPNHVRRAKKQHRVAACKTGSDGKFCFAGIAKGRYELRLSLDGGFSITHMIVKLDPQNRKSTRKPIEGFINPGG